MLIVAFFVKWCWPDSPNLTFVTISLSIQTIPSFKKISRFSASIENGSILSPCKLNVFDFYSFLVFKFTIILNANAAEAAVNTE